MPRSGQSAAGGRALFSLIPPEFFKQPVMHPPSIYIEENALDKGPKPCPIGCPGHLPAFPGKRWWLPLWRRPPLDEFIEGAERQEDGRGEEKRHPVFFQGGFLHRNFPDKGGRNESLRKAPEAAIVIAGMTEIVSYPKKGAPGIGVIRPDQQNDRMH